MATHEDLVRLTKSAAGHHVTLYVPTSPSGSETEEAALHLKVLRTKAHEVLVARGLRDHDAQELLAPLVAWELDREMWQHQQHGLAIFLGPQGVETLSLADQTEPQVFVGDNFELLPLLPHLQPEGSFVVLKLSQESAILFHGHYEGLDEVDVFAMPNGIDAVVTEDDYQNPAYASPSARPNVGHLSMSHAQVYGQAPPEWKKALRERYVEHVSQALTGRLTNTTEPTVLVADEELAGLMGARMAFTHTDTTHPESMNTQELHALAWATVSQELNQQRVADVANFQRVLGQGGLATTEMPPTLLAAAEGRVDTLLVTSGAPDPELSDILHLTLSHGGRVVYAPELSSSVSAGLGAILRYS